VNKTKIAKNHARLPTFKVSNCPEKSKKVKKKKREREAKQARELRRYIARRKI